MRPPTRLRLISRAPRAPLKKRLHWTLRVSAALILLSLFVLGTIGLTSVALQVMR